MARKLISCGIKKAKVAQKVEKRLPVTLCGKKEFTSKPNQDPQTQFIEEIIAMKSSFEQKYGAKVEILVEVTMTTTIQL